MAKKKKRYNPFKMWGSWIGAIIPLILLILIFIAHNYNDDKLLCYETNEERCGFRGLEDGGSEEFCFYPEKCLIDVTPQPIGFFMISMYKSTISILLISIPIGFLLGWGIHSLVRKFK